MPDGDDDELEVAPGNWLDRIMRHHSRGSSLWVVLLFLGAGGVVFGVPVVNSLARQAWELDASSPVVTSTNGVCGAWSGAQYQIDLEGRRHWCGGGDSKCPEPERVVVAHDLDDPARCRVAHNVDRLSRYEGITASMTLAFALAGIAGACYALSERVRKAARFQGRPARERPRVVLRVLSGIALIAAVATLVGFQVVFWFGG